jgi:hypothetical protein
MDEIFAEKININEGNALNNFNWQAISEINFEVIRHLSTY